MGMSLSDMFDLDKANSIDKTTEENSVILPTTQGEDEFNKYQALAESGEYRDRQVVIDGEKVWEKDYYESKNNEQPDNTEQGVIGGIETPIGDSETVPSPKKQPNLQKLYNGITDAETGPETNPWIRTRVDKPDPASGLYSSAYGPKQLTYSLAEDYKDGKKNLFDDEELKYLDKFVKQGKKMITYGNNHPKDPVYGFGGSGTLTSEEDKKLYNKVTEKMLADHLKNNNGDIVATIAQWRGKSIKQDPDYFAKVMKHTGSDSMVVPDGGTTPNQTPFQQLLSEADISRSNIVSDEELESGVQVDLPTGRDREQAKTGFGNAFKKSIIRGGIQAGPKMLVDLGRIVSDDRSGVNRFLTNVSADLDETKSIYDIDDSLMGKYDDEGWIALLKNPALLAQMGGEQLPQLALAIGSGNASKGLAMLTKMGAHTNKFMVGGGALMTGLGEGTSSYDEAIKQGFTQDEARNIAIGTGLATAGASVFIMDEMLGSQHLSKMVGKQFGSKMKGKTLQRAIAGLTAGGAEGIEEGLTPFATHLFSKVNDSHGIYKKTLGEVANEGMTGFVIGGVMGGAMGGFRGSNHNNAEIPTPPSKQPDGTPKIFRDNTNTLEMTPTLGETMEEANSVVNSVIVNNPDFEGVFNETNEDGEQKTDYTYEDAVSKYTEILARNGVVSPTEIENADLSSLSDQEKAFVGFGNDNGFNKNFNLSMQKMANEIRAKQLEDRSENALDVNDLDSALNLVDEAGVYENQAKALTRDIQNLYKQNRIMDTMKQADVYATENNFDKNQVITTAMNLQSEYENLTALKNDNELDGTPFDVEQVDSTLEGLSKQIKKMGIDPDNNIDPDYRISDEFKLHVATNHNIDTELSAEDTARKDKLNNINNQIVVARKNLSDVIVSGDEKGIKKARKNIRRLENNKSAIFTNGKSDNFSYPLNSSEQFLENEIKSINEDLAILDPSTDAKAIEVSKRRISEAEALIARNNERKKGNDLTETLGKVVEQKTNEYQGKDGEYKRVEELKEKYKKKIAVLKDGIKTNSFADTEQAQAAVNIYQKQIGIFDDVLSDKRSFSDANIERLAKLESESGLEVDLPTSKIDTKMDQVDTKQAEMVQQEFDENVEKSQGEYNDLMGVDETVMSDKEQSDKQKVYEKLFAEVDKVKSVSETNEIKSKKKDIQTRIADAEKALTVSENDSEKTKAQKKIKELKEELKVLEKDLKQQAIDSEDSKKLRDKVNKDLDVNLSPKQLRIKALEKNIKEMENLPQTKDVVEVKNDFIKEKETLEVEEASEGDSEIAKALKAKLESNKTEEVKETKTSTKSDLVQENDTKTVLDDDKTDVKPDLDTNKETKSEPKKEDKKKTVKENVDEKTPDKVVEEEKPVEKKQEVKKEPGTTTKDTTGTKKKTLVVKKGVSEKSGFVKRAEMYLERLTGDIKPDDELVLYDVVKLSGLIENKLTSLERNLDKYSSNNDNKSRLRDIIDKLEDHLYSLPEMGEVNVPRSLLPNLKEKVGLNRNETGLEIGPIIEEIVVSEKLNKNDPVIPFILVGDKTQTALYNVTDEKTINSQAYKNLKTFNDQFVKIERMINTFRKKIEGDGDKKLEKLLTERDQHKTKLKELLKQKEEILNKNEKTSNQQNEDVTVEDEEEFNEYDSANGGFLDIDNTFDENYNDGIAEDNTLKEDEEDNIYIDVMLNDVNNKLDRVKKDIANRKSKLKRDTKKQKSVSEFDRKGEVAVIKEEIKKLTALSEYNVNEIHSNFFLRQKSFADVKSEVRASKDIIRGADKADTQVGDEGSGTFLESFTYEDQTADFIPETDVDNIYDDVSTALNEGGVLHKDGVSKEDMNEFNIISDNVVIKNVSEDTKTQTLTDASINKYLISVKDLIEINKGGLGTENTTNPFIRSFKDIDESYKIARKYNIPYIERRTELFDVKGTPKEMIGDVSKKAKEDILNNFGKSIDIEFVNLPDGEYGSVVFNNDTGKYSVRVNRNISDAEAMTTIAHELGHAFLPTLESKNPKLAKELRTLFEQDVKNDTVLMRKIKEKYGHLPADRQYSEWVSRTIENSPLFKKDGSLDRKFMEENKDSLPVRVYKKIKAMIHKIVSGFKDPNLSNKQYRQELTDRVFASMFKNGFTPKNIDKQFKLEDVKTDTKGKPIRSSGERKPYRGDMGKTTLGSIRSEFDQKISKDKLAPELSDGVLTGEVSKKGVVGRVAQKFFEFQSNAVTALKRMGFEEGSKIHKIFVGAFNDGRVREDTEFKRGNEYLLDGMKKYGIDATKMMRKIDHKLDPFKGQQNMVETDVLDINGNPTKILLSPMERVSLMEHSKNTDNKTHLLNGGFKITKGGPVLKLSEQNFTDLTNNLSEDEKNMGKVINEWFNSESLKEFTKTYEKLNKKPFDAVQEYFPIRVATDDAKDVTSFNSDAETEISFASMENNFRRASKDGMTKERTKGSKRTIYLDGAMDAMLSHLGQTSKYIGFAEPTHNARTALTDLQGQFVDHGFETSYNGLDRMVGLIDGSQQATKGETLMKKATGKIAVGALGFRVFSALKQFGSALPASTEFTYASIPTIVADLFRHTVGSINPNSKLVTEMKEHNPTLWRRSLGRIDEAVNESIAKTQNRLGQWSMSMIKHVDTATIASIWNSSKKQVEFDGTKPSDPAYWDKVNEKVLEVVRNTQPEFNMENRAFVAMDTVFKPYTMFFSARSKTAQLLMKSVMDLRNGKNQKQALKVLVMGILAQSLLMSNLDKMRKKLKGDEEEEKELSDHIKEQVKFVGGMFAGLSVVTDAALSKYGASSDPISGILGDLGTLAKEITTIPEEGVKDVLTSEHFTKKAVRTLGLIGGVGVGGAKEIFDVAKSNVEKITK